MMCRSVGRPTALATLVVAFKAGVPGASAKPRHDVLHPRTA
jgi:hypothetical protein